MASSFHKIKQTKTYLEYEIWGGSETAERYFLFFLFLFLLSLPTFTLLELFIRGFKNNNILHEFSSPEDLIIPGAFFFSLLLVFVSTKAYRHPYLIILDAEAQQVTYRTFFTIRLKTMPISKLKSFTCRTYERSRNILSVYQADKIIGNGRIFFNGNSHFNVITIEGIRKITLKDWITFLQDINSFITVNFGLEYNFQDQIDTFKSSNGNSWIDVKFKY